MSSPTQEALDRRPRGGRPDGEGEEDEKMAALNADFATLSPDGSAENAATGSGGEADGSEKDDGSDDPTGLDDLEELERLVDAGEIAGDITDQDTSSSPSPSPSPSPLVTTVIGSNTNAATFANTTSSANAASSMRTSSPAPTTRARISRHGYPLRWTDEEDLEVLHLMDADSSRRGWDANANVFNQRFPENPPRSGAALYTRFRNLRSRDATVASIQAKMNARGG